jgi:ATP-binding cassette subfamily C exporter for protease/lipase/ATP-binding cassette subfamily C protein EexD
VAGDRRARFTGIMVAATILLGRALQPVEQLIGGWKVLVARAVHGIDE